MRKLADLAAALQAVLVNAAERLARPSGFVKRASKMTGPRFVQSLVFGSLSQPALHLRHLAQTAALGGVEISPQGIDQRFSPASVALLRGVLEVVVGTVVSQSLDSSLGAAESTTAAVTPVVEPVVEPVVQPAVIPAVLERFTHVELIDSSVIQLPQELAGEFPGCNNAEGTTAALKLDVVFDLRSGSLRGPEVRPGRAYDGAAEVARQMPERGGLRIQDLGYFSLDRLAEISAAGGFWLSRYKGGTHLYDEHQQRIDLLRLLNSSDVRESTLLLGTRHLAVRLLAEPVPPQLASERRRKLRLKASKHGRTPSAEALALCGWNLLLTNAPAAMLSLPEACALMRARWQIELLFKLWKSDLQIDAWRSSNPWRILSETYAKLIAATLQHWILCAGLWQIPDRSLRKAAAVVRTCAVMLLCALANTKQLRAVLQKILDGMRVACRLDRRRKNPSTYQRLVAASKTPVA